MKLTMVTKTNIKTKAVEDAVTKASRLAMRNIVVDIHGDAIRNAKSVKFWQTGHNARSLAAEVSGLGVVERGADASPERVVNDRGIEGAVYSTSGYGGYGETGTAHMAARPYMKPALDKNYTKAKYKKRMQEYL